jgi:stress response protein YsnF
LAAISLVLEIAKSQCNTFISSVVSEQLCHLTRFVGTTRNCEEVVAESEVTVPLVSERASVGRRWRSTGRLRVRVTPTARDEELEIALRAETAAIERVPVGRFVDEAPPIRQEGDVTIIPVLEERAEVRVRLFLREEVRVRTKRGTRRERRTIRLRTEQAAIEHDSNQGDGSQ